MAADGARFAVGEDRSGQEVRDGFADEPAERGIRAAEPVQVVVDALAQPNQFVAQGIGQGPRLMGQQTGGVVVDVDESQVETVDAGTGDCADVEQVTGSSRPTVSVFGCPAERTAARLPC